MPVHAGPSTRVLKANLHHSFGLHDESKHQGNRAANSTSRSTDRAVAGSLKLQHTPVGAALQDKHGTSHAGNIGDGLLVLGDGPTMVRSRIVAKRLSTSRWETRTKRYRVGRPTDVRGAFNKTGSWWEATMEGSIVLILQAD
jgi:hypothetical protein